MVRELTCIICPQGCNINVEIENGKVKNIEGNTCKRGYEYALSEVTNPTRTITTTVKIKNGKMLPVKTDKPVPKELIFDCMKEINKLEIEEPTRIGQVIINNILNTGVNLVATGNSELV